MNRTSPWHEVDEAAADSIRKWMDETKPPTTTTKLAKLLGYSYQGMRKKLTHNYSPFTMGEFEQLCNYFHKNSASEWMKILRIVALKNNRLNEAKIIDDMLNDHTIKNEIVNLAVTYLHPTAITDDLNDPAIMAEVKEARRREHDSGN